MQDLVQYKDTSLLVPARLATEPGINVSACAYPFTAGMSSYVVAEGYNIAEILNTITTHPFMQLQAHVYINETYVPRAYWERVYPKTGSSLTVKIIPGKGKKNPLATILMVAVIAAGAWAGALIANGALAGSLGAGFAAGTTGATIAGAFASAVVNAVGSLLVNALAPPAKQRTSGGGTDAADSPTLFIEGARNSPDYYGVVPVIFGRHLVVPKLASNNYTETVGNNQYVRQLFCLGLGKYNVYNPAIGATALSQFTDVQINQYTDGEGADADLQIYPESIFQENFQVQLTDAAGWITRTTQPACDEFIFDISYPRGIVKYNDQGKKTAINVQVEMQYAPTGTGTWSASTFYTLNNATTSAVLNSPKITAGGGQYDVRVRKVVLYTPSDSLLDDTWWVGIKTITHENPVAMKGVSLAEMRIKATDQLNGAVDQFQEELFSVLPDYDVTTNTWIERETRNPASFFRYVCLNSALFEDGSGNPLVDAPNARPLTIARMIDDDLKDFHDHCRINGFEYNAVIDFEASVQDMLAEIAAAGRAAPTLVDGKWTVVIDRLQTVIAQHFTPANTWGYSATKVFPEIPHAFRIQFLNEEAGFLQDEMLVYADGYNKTNARKIEGLQLPGITKPSLIYRHAREHMAVIKLRPIEHSFYCDVEHLVATRGRLIKFAHDVPLIGVGQGYITGVTTDGGSPANIISIQLDRPMEMQPGKSYSVRVRDAETRKSTYKAVTTVVGNNNTTLTFTTPFPRTEGMYIDDLFMFGETGRESIDLIVKDIYPDNDFVAKIVCVDASPAIFSAGTGTIPSFDSVVTLPAILQRTLAPVIKQIQTGAEVQVYNTDGSISTRMVITLENPNGFDVVPSIKIRQSGTDTYEDANTLALSSERIIIDGLDQDVLYDIQILYRKAGSGVITSTVHSPITERTFIRFEGISDNPPSVTNFKIQLVNTLALLTWDAMRLIDFAYYEIRYSPNLVGATWASAQVIKTGLTNNETTLAAASGTFMIKAVDTGNRYSNDETTASLSVVIEGTNAVETVTEDPGFTGTHTNTIVASGNLELDVLTLGEGLYEFDNIIDLSEIYPCTLIPHIIATGRNIGNTMDQWPVLSLLDSLAGSTPASWYVVLEESHTDDDPSGTPTWSPWAGINLGNYIFRAIKFRLKLFGNGINVTPSIEELGVLIDMPDRVEKLLNHEITAGGVTVTYTPAYKATPVMTYSLTNGVDGDKVEVTSETVNGFNIKVTNAGLDVTRHANIHIIGYGRVQ